MQRAGFVLPIQPGKVDEYVVAHANVWPDMRDAISDSGIQNYTIYQYGNLAIGYLESDDVAASFEALSKTDVNARWQEAMAGLLESKVDDDGPAGLTEIFHLD
jgi:L-rhamnose mutarotase